MCVELDLTRAVEQDVVLVQLLQALGQPFEVMLQLFECVENTAVRSKLVLAHDVLQLDQGPDVEGTGIVRVIVGGVEIDDGACAAYGSHELVHWRNFGSACLFIEPGGATAPSATNCHHSMCFSRRRDSR